MVRVGKDIWSVEGKANWW